jgi:23S rRNA pseudouridine1911/1915/1917 synthase
MPSRFKLQWNIKNTNSEKLVKDFLKEQEISKTALTDIKFKGGQILVNGEEVNVRYQLKIGDVLTIYFPLEEPSEGIVGETLNLDIVYEDKFLLVVNKPARMNTIPSREHPYGSLAGALVGYYKLCGIIATSHIVTRLDRDTSGLVLVAKHRHTHHLLSKQQKNGMVKRTYEALVEGGLPHEYGTIEEPIGRSPGSIIEREVQADGQYACTHYKVLEKFNDFTYVELKLETGRTHQIRVHLSYLGYPLLGDDLYGGGLSLIARQALHCKKIAFYHPFLEQVMEFEAPLPIDMLAILTQGKKA